MDKKKMTDMKARKKNLIIIREEVMRAQRREQAVAAKISNQLRLHGGGSSKPMGSVSTGIGEQFAWI
jgi:hypothetical protein